jgi:hypothetical protein
MDARSQTIWALTHVNADHQQVRTKISQRAKQSAVPSTKIEHRTYLRPLGE